MNPALSDLYQRIILDHNAAPRRAGPLPDATHQATVHNPLCGDTVTLRLRLDGEHIAAAAFEGQGCALSRASASLLCERVSDQPSAAALALAALLEASLVPGAAVDEARLGDLVALGGVRDFPSRRRCVTLVCEALRSALAQRSPAP